MKNINSFLGKVFFEANIDGKSAENNGSKGKFGLNEPTDDSAMKDAGLPKAMKSANVQKLTWKMKNHADFFIQGRAGWGKTSIIQDIAEKMGLEVITIYLDKMRAEDLGAMPVPDKDEKGRAFQHAALPEFAEPIFQNPDKKYLLFCDEMNQATPDVMNALMPIILEHSIAGKYPIEPKTGKPKAKDQNFFVGAAGNFEDENQGGVSDLSKPLASRFKPIIIWETHTDEAWADAFRYLHKTWDNQIGKKVVDKFEEEHNLFDNPREIERSAFAMLLCLKTDEMPKDIDPEVADMIKSESFDVNTYQWALEGIAKEELSAKESSRIAKLAEWCFDYINNGGKDEEDDDRKRSKDIEMVPQEIKDAIKTGMKNGWLPLEDEKTHKTRKYGISKENIASIAMDINAEQIERIVKKYEADGIQWKYKTNKEWQADGYEDPDAE